MPPSVLLSRAAYRTLMVGMASPSVMVAVAWAAVMPAANGSEMLRVKASSPSAVPSALVGTLMVTAVPSLGML